MNSALWAAAGDSLGWTTELVDGAGVKRRVGRSRIEKPVDWKRKIGGSWGVDAKLPAGTYSDDTQLRLATSRSIRGDGIFDPETFAKIELTVWPNYALGAGRGSKAASANLVRQDVNWFSNFFKSKDQSYMNGGGNGAAMRVQPHVWCHGAAARSPLLLDVCRNAITSHGHVHGFVGAAFHALALEYCLQQKRAPDVEAMHALLGELEKLPEILSGDRHIAAFWIPAWENEGSSSLESALNDHLTEAHRKLDAIAPIARSVDPSRYQDVLESLGAFEPRLRGSGTITAMAASVLCLLHADNGAQAAVVTSANALMSDTDTIGTMTGAMMGALEGAAPTWPIQDRDYLIAEASRMFSIRVGDQADHFNYPDIAAWQAPQSQADAVGLVSDGRLGMAGLGELEPQSEPMASRDTVWQWMQLPFGQTVLAKHRNSPRTLSAKLLPGPRLSAVTVKPLRVIGQPGDSQPSLPLGNIGGLRTPSNESSASPAPPEPTPKDPDDFIDGLTDRVIRSNFDPLVTGECFNRIVRVSGSIQMAVAFSAIVAKAQIARKKRG
ncbi:MULTISPECIES: ADP-ribosylglycohydrolase family protein [unclassified Brevundimonas]|uniref:ADP-ribosylglycohydrolase family protein n=1 Tax=unclassified Brevundimonas TaxID=2622653 RepID=UPI00143010F0|nr:MULTISPECIES: ADP-ribosylglycohydrolase family protein [unclassified Brevundimonas]